MKLEDLPSLDRTLARLPGRTLLLGLLSVAFIAWGLWAAVAAVRPAPAMHVRLAAGPAVAKRFQIAEALAADVRGEDLHVEVVATEGFEDSIRRVASGELELAMLSSGLEIAECSEVRVLAGLDVAPLHILVRRELAEQGLTLPQAVKGRRVNLGKPGTNDYLLASDVVRFLRLQPSDAAGDGDFIPVLLSKEELDRLAGEIQTSAEPQRTARLKELPDVIMTVASLPGVFVQNLLDTGEYRLMPFSHAEPYVTSELHHATNPEGSIDRMLVESTTIRAGAYFGDALTPAADVPTLGMRTLLVCRADVDDAVIQRLMQGVFETDFARRIKPRTAREFSSAYAIHPAAEAYLDRDKPLLSGSFFDTISSFLSVFGAFSAGALSLYGFLRRRRIRRPGEYLQELRLIDAIASGDRLESTLPISSEALAEHIDARLDQLKERVLRDYCENRVQGEMILLSILSTLADSRARLHRSANRPALDKAPRDRPAICA